MSKKEAFISAIKENEALIYKVAAIYTNDSEDRNDLVQEIIYQLWKSFDSFDQRSALSTWMYRVAMNVSIYHLKISRRKVSTIPISEEFVELHNSDEDITEERWKLLREHLSKLNLLEKGIVMLYLEGRSYEEMGQILGISTSNVGTKLSRIKEKLKKQILQKENHGIR